LREVYERFFGIASHSFVIQSVKEDCQFQRGIVYSHNTFMPREANAAFEDPRNTEEIVEVGNSRNRKNSAAYKATSCNEVQHQVDEFIDDIERSERHRPIQDKLRDRTAMLPVGYAK
jgi:hypothetical protein